MLFFPFQIFVCAFILTLSYPFRLNFLLSLFWSLVTSSRGHADPAKTWSQTQDLMNCGRSFTIVRTTITAMNDYKILPNIPDGNWIVKKTVGKKPAIAARAVDAQWNRGPNYLEVVYDVSTSYVGNKIFSVVKGYAKKITLDLAFVIQGNSRRELLERVLCAARFHSIDLDTVHALEM